MSRTEAARTSLEEERDFALAQLARLEDEREAGLLDEADYESLRSDAARRAATALRALEDAGAGPPGDAGSAGDGPPGDAGSPRAGPPVDTDAGSPSDGPAVDTGARSPEPGAAPAEDARDAGSAPTPEVGDTRPAPAPARPSRLRRWRPLFLVGAVLVVVVVLGFVVGGFAAARLPGQPPTGTPQVNATQQLSEELVQGRELVSEGQDGTALTVFQKILAAQPNQPEALAYEGWLFALAGSQSKDNGLVDEGRSDISEAVADDPSYPDAHLFLGYVLENDVGDLPDALIQYRLFMSDNPTSALLQQAAPTIDAAFATAGLPQPILRQSPSTTAPADG